MITPFFADVYVYFMEIFSSLICSLILFLIFLVFIGSTHGCFRIGENADFIVSFLFLELYLDTIIFYSPSIALEIFDELWKFIFFIFFKLNLTFEDSSQFLWNFCLSISHNRNFNKAEHIVNNSWGGDD